MKSRPVKYHAVSSFFADAFFVLSAFGAATPCFGEEFFEDADTIVIEDSGGDLAAVIEVGGLEKIPVASCGTAFDIRTAEDNAADAAVNDGPGTHGAGLFCDVEIALVEPPVAQGTFGLGEREHFGMRSGVLERLNLVPGATDDIALMHDDGSNGHFVLFGGFAGLPQGIAHEMLVVEGVDDEGVGHAGL